VQHHGEKDYHPIIAKGDLPKTTSGKIKRNAYKDCSCKVILEWENNDIVGSETSLEQLNHDYAKNPKMLLS
jgi:acyl-coenzyme A synthetase/AMP-(fatty) acid ligase